MKKLIKKLDDSWWLDIALGVILLLSTTIGIVALAQAKMPEKEIVVTETTETTAETTEESVPTVEKMHTDHDITLIGKILYDEARGCSREQQEAVVWCILNRVDSDKFPDSIEEVCLQKGQFTFNAKTPQITGLFRVAESVVEAWEYEHAGIKHSLSRNLEKGYVYFWGDGENNNFYQVWGERDNYVTPGA